MATAEQIISNDAWLLTQEPLGTNIAEVHSALPPSFSVTGTVDHVNGNGVAGIYIASAESLGLRTFSALVIDQSGTVSIFRGSLINDGGNLSVVSATEVSVTNGGMGLFPNYMSYSGTDWNYTHSGGQGIATDTSVVSPEIGGIILFRQPGDSADLSTLAQINTHRVLSGAINFPNQGSTSVNVTPLADSGTLSALVVTQDSVIHGIVGAPFGTLDVDIGKSVPWTSNFVNDLFITDTNSGDPRYWVTEWGKQDYKTKVLSLGMDYFSDPVGWRKAQFAAADAAWGYSADDWVLFIDSTEGLSCDTRTPPIDVSINPFKSYIQTEIARAVTSGLSFASIPFFAYVRDADIPDSRRFLQLADPSDVQDKLQQREIDLSVDEVNISVIEAATPYYYQQQDVSKRGLARLIKVSELRSAGFNWASIDTLSVPHDNVGVQIISYAYASWVNPATGVDDGLKMRSKISSVRPLVGMPAGGGGATGTAGPYTVAENGALTQVIPSSTQTQPLLTPLYPMLFRSNLRFGAWYPPGVFAPNPIKPPYAFAFPPPTGRGEALTAFAQVNNGEDLLFAGAPTGSGTAYNPSVNVDYSPASSSALFWVDAARSSVSSGALTNLGTAGSAYNARFGSTTGVDSFDPVLLTHTGTNYLYLPGTSVNDNVSAPSITAYDISGDIEVEVDIAFTTLTPASSSHILSREGADPNRAWSFYLTSSGSLGFRWYPTGSAASQIAKTSTATLASAGIVAGQRVTVKATLDVDNGTSGNDVRFWYSTDNGANFTQLGSTVTTAGVTSLPTVTQILYFNSSLGGTNLDAKLYRGVVRNGIGGTTVFNADFTTSITSGAQTSFTESSANAATVTINRSTSGRKSQAVTRSILLFGTDDYLEVGYDPESAYVRTNASTTGGVGATYTSYDTGTATAATSTTLTNSTKTWTAGLYVSRTVRVTGGTGIGQVRIITANTATQLTVTPAWTTTPDATSTYVIESRGNVTGDIEIVVRCALDNWANGSNQPLVVKRATGQYSYYAYMAAAGNIALSCSFDGTTVPVTFGSAVAPFTNGTAYWIRIRRTASTGAITADYAADQATEPTTWTNLSTNNTLAAGTIWQGTADVNIGQNILSGGTVGNFYTVIVRDGFGGNAQVYWQASGHPLAGNYVNANKVLWTLGATASVVNRNRLNFGASESFTIATVQRTWATPVSSGGIISKWTGGGGWHARNGFGTPTQPLISVNDFVSSQAFANPTPTLGALVLLAWTVTPTQVTSYTGNTLFGPTTRTVFEGSASETPMRIGSTAAGSSFNDFELVAAAVWPKALTATDIANLVTYFGAT